MRSPNATCDQSASCDHPLDRPAFAVADADVQCPSALELSSEPPRPVLVVGVVAYLALLDPTVAASYPHHAVGRVNRPVGGLDVPLGHQPLHLAVFRFPRHPHAPNAKGRGRAASCRSARTCAPCEPSVRMQPYLPSTTSYLVRCEPSGLGFGFLGAGCALTLTGTPQ